MVHAGLERKGCVVEQQQQQQLEMSKLRASSNGECSYSTTTMRNSDSVQAIDSKSMSRHEQFDTDDKKVATVEMQFPWMSAFRAQCRASILARGPSSLIKLISFFKRNVSSNINDCYKKSSRAVKLKELIKEALLLFVYFHRFEQPQDQNRAVYLEHMSDLLAMYIDLELVASKRDAEPQHGKISARLVSCLCVYLEKSTEHLLDTLIKVQLMNETYCQILDTVISKIFQVIPPNPETEMSYVRYLLVYRLWKKVHSNLAVKKQINVSALSSLGVCPDNLSATLPEEVLPAATTGTFTASTRFYLCQHFDLRRACSKFLQHGRQSRVGGEEKLSSAADDITERDQRLEMTIISKTINSEDSCNNECFKRSNLVKKSSSLKNPNKYSTGINNVNNKKFDKSTVMRKNKTLKEKLSEIDFIDLTNEEITKVVKRKKRRSIDWLEDLKDVKRLAALKKERDTAKNSHTQFEDLLNEEQNESSQTSNDNISTVEEVELQSTPNTIPDTEFQSEYDSKKTYKQIIDPNELTVSETKSISSPPILSTNKLVGYDSDSVPEENDLKNDKLALKDDPTMNIQRSNSTSITSPKVLLSTDKEEKVSALHNVNVSLKCNQPTDSTLANHEALKDSSSSKVNVIVADCSVIREHSTSVASVAVAENAKSKIMMENVTVNFNLTKTDNYPNKQKVQQASITESHGLLNIKESHPQIENPKSKLEKEKHVNNEKIKHNSTKESHSASAIVKQYPTDSSEVPTASNSQTKSNYNDHPDPDGIDGLILLASVSARLMDNKKCEIKVKPYTSLQQKPNEEEVNKADINPVDKTRPEEDTLIKANEVKVKVSSTEVVPNSTVIKQQQSDTSSDLLSYIIYPESIQNNLENNDNANVILNGETVMLMQKSPNSNLYIINKAAVDNLSNSKLNYNSDEEDMTKLGDYEDTKCCQPGLLIKYDPDDIVQRARTIKPDPDYVDVKSNALINHDDPKLSNQAGYEMHLADYPVPPPNSYCTYPNIHHPSTGCACVSCVYCRQLPFYLPATHATQSVQTNSAIQEKRSKPMTDSAMMVKQHHQEQMGEAKQMISRYDHVEYYAPATHATQTVQINPAVQEKRINKEPDTVAKSANLYDDQLISSIEKKLLVERLPEKVTEEKKQFANKFEQLDCMLPLKKRLKAQRMSTDFNTQKVDLPFKNKAVSSVYPDTLMMSIAELDGQSDNPPLDLGAVVEITSAPVKPTKSRSVQKDKTVLAKQHKQEQNGKTKQVIGKLEHGKINTHNRGVLNCYQKKSNSKKKRSGSADEEVENSGVSASKKSRKSRRVVPTVSYVYPDEIDTKCNPSGNRRKKRSNR